MKIPGCMHLSAVFHPTSIRAHRFAKTYMTSKLPQHQEMSSNPRSTDANVQSEVVNFIKGHPNSSLLPTVEMRSILSDILAGGGSDDSMGLNYGSDRGNPQTLVELEEFLRRNTKNDVPVPPFDVNVDGRTDRAGDALKREKESNQLFITHGVSHGIDLLCATQTNPGDVVMIERPTYFLVADIFKSHGLDVRPLPMKRNNGGLDIRKLVELVEEQEHTPPKMIYTIPINHNPTARTIDVSDRKLLAEFVARNGIVLVSDEVYHLLDWKERSTQRNHLSRCRPARMAAWNDFIGRKFHHAEKQGCCISVSSFTKIFAPGVRCGWIEGPNRVIRDLEQHGYIQSQGGCAPFMGDVMHRCMQSGVMDAYLGRLCGVLAERANILCEILGQEDRIKIDNFPTGGYFLWIRFPKNVPSEELLSLSMSKYGVKFMCGSQCDPFLNDTSYDAIDELKNSARLCFAFLDQDELVDGANRLVQAFREYVDTRL